MQGYIPTGGAGGTAKVQEANGSATNASGSVSATFASTPTPGNTLIALLSKRNIAEAGLTPAGWTRHPAETIGPAFDGGRLVLYHKVAGVAEPTTVTVDSTDTKKLYIAEWAGLVGALSGSSGYQVLIDQAASSTMTTAALTPPADPVVIFAGFIQSARNPDLAVLSPFAQDYGTHVDPSGPASVFGHRIVALASGSYTAQAASSHVQGYGTFILAFEAGAGGITWVSAPDTVDGANGTSDDVDAVAIAAAGDAFWRGVADGPDIGRIIAVLGMENAGPVEVAVQAGDESDWSDVSTIVTISYEATGSLGLDELDVTFDPVDHLYWRLVVDTAQDVRVYEVTFGEGAIPPTQEPAKAILEIYVHDEDASRWGEATWATGPATGTEGIWSAAGWTDITPEGVNVHWIWGSRRPSRGILHEQDGASINIQTYDPDRVLDPGNPDSPYYPQLVPNLPVRVSHGNMVIRTGLVEEMTWSAKDPEYQGQMLGTDTIGPLHRAGVPADTILGDTLIERVQDAINAAGIMVGGIPLPPGGPSGPALSEWVEGAATDDDVSVWEIIRKACQEVLWVPYVNADASLGLRPWGSPLDRGREITATNLEDNRHTINEDGTYSVVSVQVADPDLDPIVRVAAPLPRYGRRMYERRETTIDPEGWAAAVLADRAWPGVQYIPGTIHCFTAADVNYFGSLETMERVTITVPGIVQVQGRILGGELWVEHRKDSERGATWMFLFSVATDGATAIGLTTLVSDQSGEPLVDDMTETDYLEAD